MNSIKVLFWISSVVLMMMCLASIVVDNTKLKLPKGVKVPGIEYKLGLLILVVLMFYLLKRNEGFIAPVKYPASIPGKCQGYNGFKPDENNNWQPVNKKCADKKYRVKKNSFANVGPNRLCKKPNYRCAQKLHNKKKVTINMPGTGEVVPINMNHPDAPSVTCDKNDKKNKSMFMFSLNQVHPSCCPSEYSTSRGCVCMNDKQLKCIRKRGSV